jgi:hypothetical protein
LDHAGEKKSEKGDGSSSANSPTSPRKPPSTPQAEGLAIKNPEPALGSGTTPRSAPAAAIDSSAFETAMNAAPAVAMASSTVLAQRKAGKAREWADRSKERSVTAAETFSTVLSAKAEALAKNAARTSAKLRSRVEGKKTSLDVMLAHDRFTFTMSVVYIIVNAYLLGNHPTLFHIPHTLAAIFLISRRWWQFKLVRQHYYLYDFCYWANYASIVYCWFMPHNTTLFGVWFLAANGPLAGAVLAFMQGFIFHSAPHMTSLFIHMSPMMLSYAVRWYAPQGGWTVCEKYPTCEDISVRQMLFSSYVCFYLVWVVVYYCWVYVVMDRRIRDRGYETLFNFVVKMKPLEFLGKFTSNVLLQKAAYMAIHAVFAFLSMLVASACFFYWQVHLLCLLGMIFLAAYNASGYYFSVFAKRYVEELSKRALTYEEHRALLLDAIAAAPKPTAVL